MSAGGSLTGIAWLDTLVIIGIVGVALEAIRRWVIRPLLELRDKQQDLLADLYGRPPRYKGEHVLPGMMQRVENVEYQVTENGGSGTLRDVTQHTADTVQDMQTMVIKTAITLDEHLKESRAQAEIVRDLVAKMDAHLSWSREQVDTTEANMEELRGMVEQRQYPDSDERSP